MGYTVANDDNWVSIRMAVETLAPQSGGAPSAKALIADALRDGRLAARAEEQWRNGSLHFNPNKRTRSAIVLGRHISREEWLSSEHWSLDVERWDWMEGKIFVSRRSGYKAPSIGGMGPRYTIFIDVEVSGNDLKSLIGPRPRTKRRGGVSPQFARWESIYREMLRLAQANELNLVKFPTIDKLADHLAMHTSLSGYTTEARVSELWHDFVETSGRT